MEMQETTNISLSMMEALYMATSHRTREKVWLRRFLVNVRFVQEGSISIMCVIKGYIALAKNPTDHYCTKHIDVQHHFIKEKLENQEICLKDCPTEDVMENMQTKPLTKDRHQALISAMGLEIVGV